MTVEDLPTAIDVVSDKADFVNKEAFVGILVEAGSIISARSRVSGSELRAALDLERSLTRGSA